MTQITNNRMSSKKSYWIVYRSFYAPFRAIALFVASFLAPVLSHASPIPDYDVRAVYLVPSDKTYKPAYAAAIGDALTDLQSWYADQLGGPTFTIYTPIVESVFTESPADFYSSAITGEYADWFFNNVYVEGQWLTDAYYGDPNHIWIFYIDAAPAPGQKGGAAIPGAAVLPAADLEGLVRSNDLPVTRWIGGLGHELGHTLGLAHPAECEPVWSEICPVHSLMWLGYLTYPESYLLPHEKEILLSSPFIKSAQAVPEPSSLMLLIPGVGFLALRRRTKLPLSEVPLRFVAIKDCLTIRKSKELQTISIASAFSFTRVFPHVVKYLVE